MHWHNVVFSDESKFNLFGSDSRQYCRRRPGEEFLDRNVKKVVKHWGGSLMVWGCITPQEPGRLHRIEGRMNAVQYCEILTESFLGILADQGLSPDDVIFQQDNDPKHTSRRAQEWFEENRVTVLPWPASSPDMNLIEHVWDMLDRKVRSRRRLPSNLDDLWRILQEEWNNLNIGAIQGLYDSMPRRVEALRAAKGSYTRY